MNAIQKALQAAAQVRSCCCVRAPGEEQFQVVMKRTSYASLRALARALEALKR